MIHGPREAPVRRPVRGRVAAAFLAAAVATLAAACASGQGAPGSGQGGPITIVEQDYYGVPSPTDPTPAYLNSFFSRYEKSHPGVKVIRQAANSTNYESTAMLQLANGAAPDLLMVDNPYLPALAAGGVLVPLNKLGAVSTSTMNPANLAETVYKGTLYALPLDTNTLAIFYNKTILRQAGITTLPTTWAQFAADAKKASGHGHYGFVFTGQAGPGEATWQFDPWSWSNGGQLAKPAGRPTVQALAFLAGLVKDGAAPPDVVNWNQTPPIQEFEAGKAAFAENGLWNIPILQSQFPKLRWGVIKMPTRLAGQTAIVPSGGEVWCIPKTTPAKEKAAFQLLKAMSEPGNVIPLAKGLSAVPTDTRLWHESPWNTGVYQPFLQELRHARSRTLGLTSTEPQVSLAVGDAIQNALTGKQSAQAALRAAQQNVNSIVP